MTFEGKITLNKSISGKKGDSGFLIDADAGVMTKLRGLFPKSRFSQDQGEYTHRPLVVYISNEACKDIDWIMNRYQFDVDSNVLKIIKDGANLYDNTKKNVQQLLNLDKDYAFSDLNDSTGFSPVQGIELRDYQKVIIEHHLKIRSSFLIADEMGLGKTEEAAALLQLPEYRSSLIVVPVNLTRQWFRRLSKLHPDFKIFVTKKSKDIVPPGQDVVITNYSKLSIMKLQFLNYGFKSIIFDEIQDLRRKESDKYSSARDISLNLKCIGLSGTPIYNMGAEFYNVINIISPGCLGSETRFRDEWCEWDKVKHPEKLNKHLIERGLMIRRTAKEVGVFKPTPNTSIVEIDSDIESLKKMQDVARSLALGVIGRDALKSAAASREFNIKLRQATGVAKAKSVAEFTANVVSNGEKVLLTGWHREYWEIVTKYFDSKNIKYKMITGEETQKQKDEAALAMENGEIDVVCISLRSGAGLDGLQKSARVVIFGELDWSKNAMRQIIDRLARPGQERQVLVYFLTVNDGSDPALMGIINQKDGQFKGIIEGISASEATVVQDDSNLSHDFIKEMARKYLESIGEEFTPEEVAVGEAGEILLNLLNRSVLPNESEDLMQAGLNDILHKNLDLNEWDIKKEFVYSKRSRLDFLLTHITTGEKFIIECKNNSTNKASAYRQVRRYKEETGIPNIFLVGPWAGIKSFELEGSKVLVVDTTKARLVS